MNCPACQHANLDTIWLCNDCGRRLAEATPNGVGGGIKELSARVGDVHFGESREVELRGIAESQRVVEVKWEWFGEMEDCLA